LVMLFLRRPARGRHVWPGRDLGSVSIATTAVPMVVTVRAVAPRAVAIPLPVPIVSPISSPVPTRVQAAREARTKRKNGKRRQHGFHSRTPIVRIRAFGRRRKLGELRA